MLFAAIYGYSSESDLTKSFEKNETDHSRKVAAIVFTDENFDESFEKLKYKIRTRNLLNNDLYNVMSLNSMVDYYTKTNIFAPLQICMDESFIKAKVKDDSFNQEVGICSVYKQLLFKKKCFMS